MALITLFAGADTEALSDALARLSRLGLESLLLPVLCQIAVIVIAARLFFVLFRRLGQPGVIGEIVAGLVLGPSVLGVIWPQADAFLSHPQAAGVDLQLFGAVLRGIFGTLAELGLVFLLFLIGLEFDFKHLRGRGRAAAAISAAGVALPFLLGLALAPLTTVMTTPLVMRLMRGTELEPFIRCSGFVCRPKEDGSSAEQLGSRT
jgi:Kef-type K+ transport system membrane component KefB